MRLPASIVLTLALIGYSFDSLARGGGGSWPNGTGEVVFFLIWLLVCAYNGLMLGAAKVDRERWGHAIVIVIMLGIAAIFVGPGILLTFATAAGLAALLGLMSKR